MVKKSKVKRKKSKFGTFRGITLPKVKKLTREEIKTKLLSRKEMTLQKIIDSPTATPIAKERARRILRI